MITPIQVTVPLPSIPMPAWAHQWLMLLISAAGAVAAGISVWGPGLGLSLHVIGFITTGAIASGTLLRVVDSASETVVKNANLTVGVNGQVDVSSTTNRTAVLTNANCPPAQPLVPIADVPPVPAPVPPAPP